MASWDLSPLYRHSTCLHSPTSSHLISTHQDKTILRDLQSLQILRTWTSHNSTTTPTTTSSSIFTSFVVSPVEPYHVLAYSSKLSTAWVIDQSKDDPIAKLEIGPEGSVGMNWTKDGKAIMSWSQHSLRITIFRLSHPTSPLFIQSPKIGHPDAGGYCFNPRDSGEGIFLLALLERHQGRDCIAIYDTNSWTLLRNIVITDPTSDLVNLSWSPCGRYIVTWSSITNYYLHIYTPDGRHLSTFSPYASLDPSPAVTNTKPLPPKTHSNNKKKTIPSGKSRPSDEINNQEENENNRDRLRSERSTSTWVGLGIRTVESDSQRGDWLAVGGYDGKVRILSRLGHWKVVAELGFPNKVMGGSNINIWEEPRDWIEKTYGKGIVAFNRIDSSYTITPVPPDVTKPNPRMGVSKMSWSRDGRYLACYNQTYPTNLYVFSILTPTTTSSSTEPRSEASTPSEDDSRPQFHFRPKLDTLIVLNQTIRSFEWRPPRSKRRRNNHRNEDGEDQDLLAIVSGSKSFTLFNPSSSSTTSPTTTTTTTSDDSSRRSTGLVEGVGIPTRDEISFSPTSISFAPDGQSLLICEPKNTFCVAYPVEEEERGNEGGEEGGGGDRTWIED